MMREIPAPLLNRLTTIRLGGEAICELHLENEDDLDLLAERLAYWGGEACYMGRGSNIVAKDGQLEICIIKVKTGQKIEKIGNFEDKTIIRASADTPLPTLLRYCLRHGYSGLEGLCGIPGQVGGAVAMNAGSFGTDVYSNLHGVTIFDGAQVKYLKKDEISSGYRKMVFPEAQNKTIILKADFTLTQSVKNVIFTRMSHNFFEKKSRQPLGSYSAGCAFKNPVGYSSAGKLLDVAGLRGKRLGGMAFSSQHANFLINEGTGSYAAARDLLELAKDTVKSQFGIALEEEIKIIG